MGKLRLRSVLWSLLPLLLTLVPGALAAQEGALAGTVRASETAEPLASVQVQLLDAGEDVVAGALTSSSGRYRIDGIPAGTYTVSFDLPGRATVRRPGIRVQAGSTTDLSVAMPAQAYELNPLTVSAARQQERLVDAPASVQVVGREAVESEPALSHLDYVEGMAGVNVIKSGLQQGYVVARGFNNVFSGSMLTLTDHRIARVPSLRANIPHLDPTTSLDIDRVEVVLGPGSALYGPNAAAGVLHKLTKSPIDDPESTISVAGGLRQQGAVANPLTGAPEFSSSEEGVLLVEGRLAHRFSDEFGVKVSGDYFSGEDYRFVDPDEVANGAVADACLATYSLANPACLTLAPTGDQLPDQTELQRIGQRDFDLERWSLNAEAEWRPADDATATLTYGRSQAVNSIDLTGIGAGQVKDWAYQFAQARFTKDDLFAQAFVNWTDSGDTYILRTGQPIRDESYIAVGQLQHATEVSDRQRFVYGADYIHTTPQTNRTINGVHEDDDEIDEYGFYLQSETQLAEPLELTLAARGDYHSVLDETIFSPRGALVYQPDPNHGVRLTYNRAFSTPDNNNLFLDIMAQRVPIGASGFSYGLNAQGTTDRGFSFAAGPGGRPMMKSPFTPAGLGGPGQFLPTRTPTLWQLAVGVVGAQDPAAGALLSSLPVPDDSQVATLLRILNTGEDSGTTPFLPFPGFDAVRDVPPIQEEITNTFEVGYKGLVADRLLLSTDVYFSRIEDFIGPLEVVTPNAFLDGTDVAQYLIGFGVDPATAQGLAEQVAQIPLGVVTPEQVAAPGANMLLTYRNVGDVDLWGTDVSATYQVTDMWELGLATSFVSDNLFRTDQDARVELNAPDFKIQGSLAYRNEDAGFRGKASYRFVNGFPAASGVFVGQVPDHEVVDLKLSYRIPTYRDVSLQLDVQNLLDEEYHTFPGSPTLGRFTMARVMYRF